MTTQEQIGNPNRPQGEAARRSLNHEASDLDYPIWDLFDRVAQEHAELEFIVTPAVRRVVDETGSATVYDVKSREAETGEALADS